MEHIFNTEKYKEYPILIYTEYKYTIFINVVAQLPYTN